MGLGGDGGDDDSGSSIDAEQLMDYVEDAPSGLVVVDEAGYVAYANEAAHRLLGRADLVGQRFGFPMSRHRTSEIEVRDAEGRIRECEMQVTRVRADGRTVRLATLHEISQRAAGERRLLAEVESRQDVIATTSRELRGPLELMSAAADDLAVQWEKLAPIRRLELLRRIREQAWTMEDTVTGVLDATALDAGLVVPERAPTSVLEVVLAGLPEVREFVEQFDVDIDADVTADVSAEHLWTILANLIVNAAKFAPGPVTVSAAERDGWCRIEVSDQGPGIAETDREAVFDRHARLSQHRHIAGLGLGLWIVRGLAEVYGGDARIEAPGPSDVGTRVSVKVPCVPASVST